MNAIGKPWGFGSALLGLLAALGFVAASAAVPSAQAPAGPAAASGKPVTFTKDVAPILQRSCQNCHRPDQMAPMSLLTYEDARPYARSIKNRVVARGHAAVARGAEYRDPEIQGRSVAHGRRDRHDRGVGRPGRRRRATWPTCRRRSSSSRTTSGTSSRISSSRCR